MATPYEKMALREPQTKILCGLCEGDIEGPTDPNPQDTFRCVKCGNSDTFENVMRIAGEHFKEHVAKGFQSNLRKATRGSKVLTFKESFIPKGNHRFIVNLEAH